MKTRRIVGALLLGLLLWAQPASAAITICDSGNAHTSAIVAGGGTVTTSPINATGATLLTAGYAGVATGTFSDSSSNSWTTRTTYSGTEQAQIAYVGGPSGSSSHTATYTVTNGFGVLFFVAWCGTATSTPYDVENGATTGGAATLQTGSVTPSADNYVLFSIMGGHNGAAGGFTVSGGLALLDSVNYTGGSANAGASAYEIQTTATTRNPTWTMNTSDYAATAIAVFKVSSGSGGATSHPCSSLRLLGVGCEVAQ